MPKPLLRAVEKNEPLPDRELARRLIKDRNKRLKNSIGKAQVHDESRKDERPAPSLDVDDAVRKGTYEINRKD